MEQSDDEAKTILDNQQIRCIFFSEFHPTLGPIISCQEPDQYISKELFDSISVYIITKADLLRSSITVTLPNNKILGYPVKIENNKYPRNAYHFNVCLVFDSSVTTVHFFEPVLIKLTEFLIALETENSFLSTRPGTDADNGQPSNVLLILKKILNDLNTTGECRFTGAGTAYTHLKLLPIAYDLPPNVSDFEVPIIVRDVKSIDHAWDLTTHQLLSYINGFNQVARIASLSGVEVHLVKACIRNLMHYNVVVLLAVFQYNNMYCTTPQLRLLSAVGNTELRKSCIEFVALSHSHLPYFRDVFRLYAAMKRGTTVKDLCQRFNPSSLFINERRLVQFGLLKGFIRRTYKYPVLMATKENTNISRELQYKLDGRTSLDEACWSTETPLKAIEEKMEDDHNIIMLWK